MKKFLFNIYAIPFFALGMLPYPVLYMLSNLLYYLAFYVIGYRKKVVFDNIRNAFPTYTEQQVETIAKNFYKHLIDVFLETFKLLTCSAKELYKKGVYHNFEVLKPFIDKKQSFDSAKNGKINVIRLHDKLVVNTRNANQSFDGLHALFSLVFNDLQLRETGPQKILCLGLAGGSIVHIIKNELQLTSHITAIEYDEVMVQIANKYFSLQQFSNINIIVADAFEYAAQNADTARFNLIIVDLFEDNKVASKVFDTDFNGHLLNMCPSGTIIINAICTNKNQLQQLNTLFSFYKSKPNNCTLKTYPIAPENKVLIVQT